MATRGIRNHNPGNIRLGDKWQGLAEEQTDPAFCVFISHEYGCRAMLKILKNYVEKYNCKTITDIVARWAPPSENNTYNYISYVSYCLKKSATEKLSFNKATYLAIAKAIAQYENGPDAKVLTKAIWEAAYAML